MVRIMESNNNKPLQQKTFNKNVAITTGSTPATMGPLKQKTFKQQGTGSKIQHNIIKKQKNKTHNMLANISKTKYIRGLAYVVWIVVFGVLNFSVLYKFDFRISTGVDWVYLIVMLAMSVPTGLYYFINELEKRDGYILKYLVATIVGICGNFLGLLFSLIGCLVVYVVLGIVKWFVG